jgi:hypothetical protein
MLIHPNIYLRNYLSYSQSQSAATPALPYSDWASYQVKIQT